MDRQIVYPGQIPLETDLLNTNLYAMVGLGKLAQAVFNSSTTVGGLACVPTSPPGLRVQVNPGEIYSLQNVDGSPYSSLPTDTAHALMKQGLLTDSVQFDCPAPTNGGQSVVYLIQALYQDVDANAVTLPYYNASNPAQGFSGPNNSGTAQYTTRKGLCRVVIKAGLAAATGSQKIPAADPDYTGLWAITVAYAQTSILQSHITAVPGAPLITESVLQKISQATADARYLQLTAAGANYAPLASPALTGTPTAPTPASGNNSTQLATTGFVQTVAAGLSAATLAAAPPGTVSHFAMATAPAGWLKANGAAVSRSVYSNLFSAIGTLYGAGDGSSTFNLPDLRGEFIRNWDDSRGIDNGRGLGSWQGDIFGSHAHNVARTNSTWSGEYGSVGRINLMSGDRGYTYTNTPTGNSTDGIVPTQFVQNTGGPETRPRNIALLACIKY